MSQAEVGHGTQGTPGAPALGTQDLPSMSQIPLYSSYPNASQDLLAPFAGSEPNPLSQGLISEPLLSQGLQTHTQAISQQQQAFLAATAGLPDPMAAFHNYNMAALAVAAAAPPTGMTALKSSTQPPSSLLYCSAPSGPSGNSKHREVHHSLLKPEHRNSKASRRGPMDEMRQLVRILVKLMPQSMYLLAMSDEGGGGNRVSEEQIKDYLKGTLGMEPPQPEWGLPAGWGHYLAQLFTWALDREITRDQAMMCARRQPGRSWEAVEDELQRLGIFSYAWPIPLTKAGVAAAQARAPPPPTPAQLSAMMSGVKSSLSTAPVAVPPSAAEAVPAVAAAAAVAVKRRAPSPDGMDEGAAHHRGRKAGPKKSNQRTACGGEDSENLRELDHWRLVLKHLQEAQRTSGTSLREEADALVEVREAAAELFARLNSRVIVVQSGTPTERGASERVSANARAAAAEAAKVKAESRVHQQAQALMSTWPLLHHHHQQSAAAAAAASLSAAVAASLPQPPPLLLGGSTAGALTQPSLPGLSMPFTTAGQASGLPYDSSWSTGMESRHGAFLPFGVSNPLAGLPDFLSSRPFVKGGAAGGADEDDDDDEETESDPEVGDEKGRRRSHGAEDGAEDSKALLHQEHHHHGTKRQQPQSVSQQQADAERHGAQYAAHSTGSSAPAAAGGKAGASTSGDAAAPRTRAQELRSKLFATLDNVGTSAAQQPASGAWGTPPPASNPHANASAPSTGVHRLAALADVASCHGTMLSPCVEAQPSKAVSENGQGVVPADADTQAAAEQAAAAAAAEAHAAAVEAEAQAASWAEHCGPAAVAAISNGSGAVAAKRVSLQSMMNAAGSG